MARILVIYETLSGNTRTFVDYLIGKYKAEYVFCSPKEFEKNVYYTTERWDAVFLGCYTWSEGKIPVKTKRATIAHRLWLSQQNLFIFGTGWTMYPHFCRAVDSLQIIVGRECPHIKFELNYNMKQNRECDEEVASFMANINVKERKK